MNDDNFEQNGFIIDLSDAKDTSEIINQLSNILELPEAQNKQIRLKLGVNVDLSKSQLLSVKALINSMNSELINVNSPSTLTVVSAESLGIDTKEPENVISVSEEENSSEESEKDDEIPQAPLEEESDYVKSVENQEITDLEDNEKAVDEIEEVKEVVEDKEEKPQLIIETREVAEDEIPEEIIETQKEKVETNYELFNPKEEVVFEKNEAEDKLSEMLDVEDTPQKKEQREKEAEISNLPTLYIQDTLRSGQTMSYDGNVVIIGDVHPGSEIIAKGDITIWGVLGGIAHAGARGNDFAKIRALKMNAIQLRISGYYARRPDSFNIPYIQRTNEFTPEEARVEDEQIAIYKIYD